MKKQKDYTIELLLLIFAIALLASLASCSSSNKMPRVKRDCQGRKHYRHQNGFYIYSPKKQNQFYAEV